MKYLKVEPFKKGDVSTAITELSFLLDGVDKNLLNQVPWKQYQYQPKVQFSMAYDTDCIFLKYYVNEKFIQAANGVTNTAVNQDSCVEFFICIDDDKAYYNFEFNCIGTTLVGYGETRNNRALLSADLISQIKYQSVINNHHSGKDVNWELTVVIPGALFYFHPLLSFAGKKCRANFYKCGDHLPTPHFISWSNINSQQPDFHLSEFFGTLQFV